MASKWISYNQLAWTEGWLAGPEEYEEEARIFVDLLKAQTVKPPRSLLHLGCGAGGLDTFFKEHFEVTGVDLSKGMLDLARKAHPDIEYIEGDMRALRLDRQFDAVAIPDSIDYMATEEDLKKAVQTSVMHLKCGGVLLIAAKKEENFQNNNFAYTGEKENIQVTLLENNYINPFHPNTYEATFIYLIRRKGKLTIHTEHQVLGLFSQTMWKDVFHKAGIQMRQVVLEGIYDPYILNEGEYPITVFIGKKDYYGQI